MKMKLVKKLLAVFLLIVLSLVVYINGNILYSAKYFHPEKSDVIIVLGCQIWGLSPSWSLEYRLQKALDLYNDGFAPYVIVSGGQGADEEATEASVMKKWLKEKGVAEAKILEEGKSTDTFENLSFSKSIMEGNNFRKALIVTNDFHIYRSLRLAKKLSMEASGGPAPTVRHLKAYYYFREMLSVVKSYILYR